MSSAANKPTCKGEIRSFPVKFNGRSGKASKKFKSVKLMEIHSYFEKIRKNCVYFVAIGENDEILSSSMVSNPKLYNGMLKRIDNISLLSLIYKVSPKFPVDVLYEDILINNPEWVELEKDIGVEFRNKKTLQSSLIHNSFTKENKLFIEQLNLVDIDNQRLEHLGDSVLGTIISKYTYDQYLSFSAGNLTMFKVFLVKNNNISKIADKLNLDNYLLKGTGESKNNGGKRTRLANVFEAVIGAIFSDQGYDKSKEFVLKYCVEDIVEFLSLDSDALKSYIEEHDIISKFNKRYQYLYGESPIWDYDDPSTDHPLLFSCTIHNLPVTGFGSNHSLARKDFSKKFFEFLAQ